MASLSHIEAVLKNAGVLYDVKTPHHLKVGTLNFYPGKESFNCENQSKLGVGVDEFLKLVKDKHPVYVTK